MNRKCGAAIKEFDLFFSFIYVLKLNCRAALAAGYRREERYGRRSRRRAPPRTQKRCDRENRRLPSAQTSAERGKTKSENWRKSENQQTETKGTHILEIAFIRTHYVSIYLKLINVWIESK